MSETNWNKMFEYLRASRVAVWNDDYMEFLIEKVWKINKPVNIIDFGCGIGWLASFLLPKLPEGSTYTGIDKAEELLNEAKRANNEYKVNFVQGDLTQYIPIKKYDIAICQAVLQHIPNGLSIIDKMRDSVVEGGKVICIELNININNSIFHIDGLDVDQLNMLGVQQSIWHKKSKEGLMDFFIGLKIPSYMQQIGLKNVDTRLNDCIRFANASLDKEDYDKKIQAFKSSFFNDYSNKEQILKILLSNGLTQDEAEKQYEYGNQISNYINSNHIDVLTSMGFVISYGTV